MTKLPRVTGKKVLSALLKAGFQVSRIKGSHHFIKHPDGRRGTVPIHAGDIIDAGLMNKILRDVKMTKEDFIDLL